jgi:hypothetical protein
LSTRFALEAGADTAERLLGLLGMLVLLTAVGIAVVKGREELKS